MSFKIIYKNIYIILSTPQSFLYYMGMNSLSNTSFLSRASFPSRSSMVCDEGAIFI